MRQSWIFLLLFVFLSQSIWGVVPHLHDAFHGHPSHEDASAVVVQEGVLVLLPLQESPADLLADPAAQRDSESKDAWAAAQDPSGLDASPMHYHQHVEPAEFSGLNLVFGSESQSVYLSVKSHKPYDGLSAIDVPDWIVPAVI
jgi:hypothetical protein